MLRPARTTDAGAAGDILHRFQQETEWMPMLWSGAETIAFCGSLIDRGWVTVAEAGGRVAGFLARDGEEVCSLYVLAEARGSGIGRALLASAMASSPRLVLRTFAANTAAQQFYLGAGFAETGRGDGSGNDEGLPDIAYEWRARAEAAA